MDGQPFKKKARAYCVDQGCDLSEMSLEQLQTFSELIQADVFEVLKLEGSVAARDHIGGTAPRQVRYLRGQLGSAFIA